MASHLSKDSEAQIAQNCDLTRGDLRPLMGHLRVQNLTDTGILNSLYLWRRLQYDTSHWIVSPNVLDFARSPIAGEAHDRVYVTGMNEPRVLTNSIISAPFDFTTDYYKLGVPAPTAAPTVDAGYTTGPNYRAYIYTYVVKLGTSDAEEGPNSPIVEVDDYGTGNITLSGFTEPPSQRSIGKIRIYRTASSSAGVAEFLYVGEFDTDGVDFSTYTFTDNVTDAGLGEALTTENWTPPPEGLSGLIAPNGGALVGFVGNRVYFSEPYLPHAWPYSYPVDSTIIGLGWLGNTVIVLTDEFMYMMSGQVDAISTQKLPGRYPCVSKAGIVSCELGVLYPADEGIVLVTQDGPQLLTYEFFTKGQYNQSYSPRTIRAVYYEGMYMAFSDDGTCFTIDIRDKTLSRVGAPTEVHPVFHVSLTNDNLYFVASDEEGLNAIYQYGASETDKQTYVYRSKNWILGSVTNLSAARVLIAPNDYDATEAAAAAAAVAAAFAAGSTDGVLGGVALNDGDPATVNGDGLEVVPETLSATFNLYCDNTLLFTATVTDETPFRLPAEILYRRCFYELVGNLPVDEIVLATSMGELDA